MTLPYLSNQEIEYEVAHQEQSRQSFVVIFVSVLLGLSYIGVILRLVSRRIQRIRLAWNDVTLLIALALATAMSGILLNAVKLGLGRHIIFIGLNKTYEVAKMLYLLEILLNPCNFAVKLSILLLYRTVFGEATRWFRISLHILGAFWLVDLLLASFLLIFQCYPVSLAWTSDHSEGCLNLQMIIMGMTVYSVFLNFATLVLPWPIIWKLKLSMRRKISVAILFAFAGIGFVTVIIRCSWNKHVDPTQIDVTWLQAPYATLAVMEMTIDIICASAPTLPPVYRTCRAKLLGSRTTSYSKSPARTKLSSFTAPFVLRMSRRRKLPSDTTLLNETYFDDTCHQPETFTSELKILKKQEYDVSKEEIGDEKGLKSTTTTIVQIGSPSSPTLDSSRSPSLPGYDHRHVDRPSIGTEAIDFHPPPRYPSPVANRGNGTHDPGSFV